MNGHLLGHSNKILTVFIFDVRPTGNPFWTNIPFLYPVKKNKKTSSFLVFSGGLEKEHWHRMGYTYLIFFQWLRTSILLVIGCIMCIRTIQIFSKKAIEKHQRSSYFSKVASRKLEWNWVAYQVFSRICRYLQVK